MRFNYEHPGEFVWGVSQGITLSYLGPESASVLSFLVALNLHFQFQSVLAKRRLHSKSDDTGPFPVKLPRFCLKRSDL